MSKINKNIMMIIDCFTKEMILIIMNSIIIEVLVKVFFKQFYVYYELFKAIVNDKRI